MSPGSGDSWASVKGGPRGESHAPERTGSGLCDAPIVPYSVCGSHKATRTHGCVSMAGRPKQKGPMRPSNGWSITVVLSMALLLSGRTSSCLAASSGWTPNGVRVAPADSAQLEPRIVPDGTGGAIITWEDKRGGPFLAYTQRLTADGSVASGWPVGGVLLPNRGLSQVNLTAIADGTGGAFVASDDNGFGGVVLVHHLGADGAPAAGWPSAAVSLQTAPYGVPGGVQGAFLPALLTDDAGGVFVA